MLQVQKQALGTTLSIVLFKTDKPLTNENWKQPIVFKLIKFSHKWLQGFQGYSSDEYATAIYFTGK